MLAFGREQFLPVIIIFMECFCHLCLILMIECVYIHPVEILIAQFIDFGSVILFPPDVVNCFDLT